MKIVNICLAGSYNYGWGYQDNLISKYQHKNGNDVILIASRFTNDKNSEEYLEVPSEIKLDNGVKVIRLEHGLGKIGTKFLRHYKGLYKVLVSEKPDFIFIHGLQFIDILYVCKYLKKHPEVNCCVDGHADYTNSAQSKFSYFVHKTLWKYCAQQINKYAKIFYGVLPVRCEFMMEMYGIPENKVELLVMGADDEFLSVAQKNREKTRKDMKFSESDFVIITGGKIDAHKTETILLMKAVNELSVKYLKLLVFGAVAEELKEIFNSQLSDRVRYIGWLDQKEIYKYICASDCGFFPGRHSVIWEQMVAAGIPSIFRKLPKTDHVDIGGNCLFLDDGSEESIKEAIEYIIKKENYIKLKNNSSSLRKNNFLYSNIAKDSIENVIKKSS
ncbi:glycosyltransferase family 4 protein [Holdemania massiliensis]|uniref:Glycosyltransferase n=1 Tax=Holdemania massiliensis TaxID=1468449 RepID=A0A6N7S8H1_9FIRM|nr:glycosyltransferase family 4 protein [Holdemania massiliensis]MSA71357.1 glycosyltransferase [Holdemania massiliensis]MSA89606.1 glycosyltransferase [Holdemania massiliensis]MSB78437.1 glycosyltransferase [Holdemania massiliensis]MSC33361.1 glycosyltransferase [Holdemania massiliensis]MSC39752.1 glycosyltransferase [Holdemania massiliensis]